MKARSRASGSPHTPGHVLRADDPASAASPPKDVVDAKEVRWLRDGTKGAIISRSVVLADKSRPRS